MIAAADGESGAARDRRTALAAARDAGHARHQRTQLSRDRRGDRRADRHGHVPAVAGARGDRAKPWKPCDERAERNPPRPGLRVNAALDGELDAAHALALRARTRGRPGAAAPPSTQVTSRARRAARAGARGAGPDAAARARPCAGRGTDVAALPARAARRARDGWLSRPRSPSLAFIGGYGAAPALASPERRSRAAGAGRRLRARAGFGAAVRRRLVGPAHRKTLARRAGHARRRGRRPRRPGLPARGRANRHRRRRARADAGLSPARTFHQRERIAASRRSGAGACRGRSLDGYHIERWSDSERAYVAISDLDAGGSRAFAELFRRAQSAAAGSGHARANHEARMEPPRAFPSRAARPI